jgi:hypothetical protein
MRRGCKVSSSLLSLKMHPELLSVAMPMTRSMAVKVSSLSKALTQFLVA